MVGWPKTIFIRGIGIPVESWEELDEVIHRYGAEGSIVIQGSPGKETLAERRGQTGSVSLSPADRSLLQQFVESGSNGVPTKQIGPALGKRGKSIRPALDAWSRRIGLVTEEGSLAFEPTKTSQGRGFRLVGVFVQAARSMLGT